MQPQAAQATKELRRLLRGIENPERLTFRLVDARGNVLGRLASQVATMLQGKDKPTYQPSQLDGDVVIVVNAKYVELTGKKWLHHHHTWYTGYPGGLKERSAIEVWKREPEALVEEAVWGMLPRNNLRKDWMRRLRIFPTEDHPFAFMPRGQSRGQLQEVAVQTRAGMRDPARHPILDCNSAFFWVRRHKPDGEQHWVEEVAAGKARLLDEGIEWRDGRADYHGPAGGPEGGRQEPAWLRAPHGSLLAAVAPASAPVAGAKAKKP